MLRSSLSKICNFTLAEYRQRKAHADSQKKQKKKKKKPAERDSEGDSLGRTEGELNRPLEGGESTVPAHDGEDRTTEFSFTKTLRSGETVKHNQTYNIEPESEVSTTAEDYSSEEEVDPMERVTRGGSLQEMEDVLAEKCQEVEELSRELEEMRSGFGADGVQQLQDFEAALKQRDGIITQLTANLQQAREEKDEIMKEFLELTEQSQRLQIQFQQLQAGESLRNSSHTNTAADLLQARQQLLHLQQQLQDQAEDRDRERDQRLQAQNREDTETVSHLQDRINGMETEMRRAEESLNEKDLLITEQEKTILNHEQSLKELRMSEKSFAQTLKEKTQLLLEQSAIISEHEQSLNQLRTELSRAAVETNMQQADEKDEIIAEKDRVIIERDYAITQLEDELESSQKHLHNLSQRMTMKEVELERCLETLESTKSDLESCENELNNCKSDLEKERSELESCKNELSLSKQKEKMSSNEIMQLMGTVEDLQKRCHQGSLSENETIQKMQEDTERKLEVLRAELDEMYGQQIVQMKTELNLQNSARVEQINQQHQAEIELLKKQYLSDTLSASTSEIEALTVKIRQLQETIEYSKVIHDKTVQELNKVNKEKLNLQEKTDSLIQDLKSAKEQVELVSHNAVSQESHKRELQLLQDTIDNLKHQLEAAQESAQETQEKYESETTNYKIKLEMLEREKDAVLDRMAESQEAELDRLRTHLLFSHEEELTNLREDLQRENFLNTENLLNEAAIKHEKSLDNLRMSYDEKVNLLQQEKENVATERDELLHQILELKEDLNVALHSSKADELVQQLQKLQAEIEELRKGGEERLGLDSEIRSLQEKIIAVENQAKDNEQMWDNKFKEQESEIEMINMSNKNLKEEIDLKTKDIQSITAEKDGYQQQVVTLTEEMEKQRTAFSFAEKNFEVNYQELKDEYTCLVETKKKLEEQKIQETLELEAKICCLEAQIQKMEDRVGEIKMDEGKTVIEKDSTEVMEKLNITLIEKESLAGRLREVTEKLTTAERKVESFEQELIKVKQENAKVIAQNENLGKALENAHENAATISDSDNQQLRGEIQTLQSLLKAAEEERDKIQQTLELHRVSQTPSPALREEVPVAKGPSSSLRSTSASGSNRRKKRQRNKRNQGGVDQSSSREKEREEEGGTAAEGATSAAEPSTQTAVVMSCTHEPIAKEDDSDESQGDVAEHSSKQVTRHGMRHQPEMRHGAEEVEQSGDHGECRLRMEAQHISLSQIHAAQLELLQEEADAQTKSAQMRLQKDQRDQAAPMLSKYQNMVEAVSEECREIILAFQKMFGEDFFDKAIVEEFRPLSSNEKPGTSESSSVIQAARELYRDLQQVRDSIEQEHHRLSQLQTLLRADGNKMMELQSAYDNLKSSTDKEMSNLRLQVLSVSSGFNQDLGEQAQSAAATSTSHTSAEIQMLKVEAQEKQQQLEQSHRQEVERLRAHYQQQAAETEERYATELFMLQQRLQEVNAAPSHFSSSTESSGFDKQYEQLKEVEDESSEGGWATTPQLQSLKKALQQKYVQEVEALKEQHSVELRRLAEQRGGEAGGEELREETSGSELEPQHWERVEEEVAKAIVQMSVEFAQKTELARLSKDSGQTSSSMQTESQEEERTPRACVTVDWGESERDQLHLELQQRDSEMQKLRDQLQKAEKALNQALKQGEDEEVEAAVVVVSSAAKTTHAPRAQSHEDEQEDGQGAERALLLRANEQLSQVLVDVLTTTSAAEKTLGLHLHTLRNASTAERVKPATGDRSAGSCSNSESGADEELFPFVNVEAEEDLEMLQHMDCLLQGASSQLENQDYLTNISTRLQNALEKMLMAITNATDQLEHAKLTQTELMRESFRHNQEMSELLQRQDELQERLSEEARAREQLALELHRAEGVIDGYSGERTALEEKLRQKEELHLTLEQELEMTSSRLQELEQERLQMQEERELMSRQQDAMREEAGPRELHLLEETEKLMLEKVEVQLQAEKQSSDLLKQVKLLEVELEEQVTRVMELEQTQTSETTDLQQQIQALEKQLDKNRRFLDEQAVDREHERDFFQTEIQKLEDQLKSSQKPLSGSEQRNLEVEQLNAQLKEKADWCSELLLSSEQLQRELGERNEEIDKLESRIRELEQALLASAESLEVEQKKHHASITEARHPSLETQLQTEREALERKEKEICNLEEQLEQFKEELENKSEELQQLQMQLEIQRKEIDSQQQDLDSRDSLLQVVEEKDREIALLNEQISKLQHTDTASDNKEMNDQDELVRDLESQVECLRSEQQRLKRDHEEEMDQLNSVIDKLQQELANIEQKTAVEDYEEDKGLPERPTNEEYDEIKQKMDSATKELDTLKSEHGKLFDTYLRLKESAEALAESEKAENLENELEDALREKTAALVVMQAEVQALEQSATYKVEELDRRIHELEDLVGERDNELSRCRLIVEQTQNYADGLQEKIYKLEANLREKVAEVLVSQATLSAFQQQQSPQPKNEPVVYDFGSVNIPHLDFSGYSQSRGGPTGRVVHLTEKLRELEVGLSGMQNDRELQNQLLSSSEDDILEYERRLTLLMDLLSQMKTGASHKSATLLQTSSSSSDQRSVAELLQELQEVRDEASFTKERLDSFKESCSRLQDELTEKTLAIQRLEEQMVQSTFYSGEQVRISELQHELKEAHSEASAAKDELISCKDSLDKLQELLQEREVTIAQLKEEPIQASSNIDEEAKVSELQQQLKEAQSEASVAKEELSGCKESVDTLQEMLQEREMTIAQLKGELFQVKADEDSDSFTEVLQKLEEATKTAALTKEELNSIKLQNVELEDELKSSEVTISKLKEQLQEVINNMENTKEALMGLKEQNEKLQDEASDRESLISSLKVELQEAHTALVKQTNISSPPSPSPSPQPPSSFPSITQSKKKGLKQPAPKGSSAKDKPSLSRKNSSSSHSSHKSHKSNGSTEQHHTTDAFTQTENLQIFDHSTLGPVQSCESAAKDEVQEVIRKFQEKIEQMQELHAAEILDMESRHISESENLRRDTQVLEGECKALKAVIEKLRSNEASSVKLERSASQFKDGYTSDSSSDFSQRTGYDLPSLQQEFRTTPEGARRDNDENLPDRIKTLLREVHQEGMQVLSLSELPLSEADSGAQFNIQGWMKERDALLSTVESLKGLITTMQTHRQSQTSGGVDWRGQLLDAVQKVFQNERSVLKNTLYSQLDLLDTSDAIIHLNQLEQRLSEQDAQQKEALGFLHSTDRSSLLSEIHQLRIQMERIHQGGDSAAVLGSEFSLTEHTEAGGDQLLVEDLKTELSQTKLELETTIKAQHKHIKEVDTLRAEVSQKASEVDALSDQLIEEKKKSRDLQWAVEKERCRTGRSEESQREELEDLQLDLEQQKALVSRLTTELEQQRQTSSQSSQQVEQERLSLQRRLQELQVQLDTERAKAQEMSSALGRERELRRGGSSDGGHVTAELGEEQRDGTEEERLLERLQNELDDKHAQVVQLLGQVEAQKLEVVRKNEELNLVNQRSTRDHEALLESQALLEKLKTQMRQTQEQLDREMQRGEHLEEQRGKHLEEQRGKHLEEQRGKHLEEQRGKHLEEQRGKHLEEQRGTHLEEQRGTHLEEQRLGRGEDTADGSGPLQAEGHTTQWEGENSDRTKDWVLQHKTSSPSSHLDLTGPGPTTGLHHGPWRTVDSVLGKLHLVSAKVHSLADQAAGSSTAEVDTEELSWVQSNIDEVISMLKQSPSLPPLPESSSLAGSSSSLTERLLRQNAELTGFVSRLTEEKNDMRNHMLRLEEELRRYRHIALGSTDALSGRKVTPKGDSTSLLLSQEREAWIREKTRLEKALHQAQSQVARLKTEVRTETLREISGPDSDNASLKRIYGKYLRSESFRKALVYQKKYLLLLLGGFQECEEATLTLLSRMGGRPALSGLETFSQRRKGLTRFRSAVRVSIALSRMRFLVKRWHKTTGLSGSPSSRVTKNGSGQTLGTDVRDSPYLHPGSVEMYKDRDRGVSSSRGRSGRESPRSAASAQHRYHVSGDHGPLTCSHLQNYDPDRALTDYISRLEALQRRLGSVTSGASSYAQLHFGLRR